MVVVYGDVNSSLAAALAAAKLGIPVAHVEAGLRSFDRSMPEEVNREVADLLAELLFATSPDAVDHLVAMGVPARRIHFVGNPMIDTLVAQLHHLDPEVARAAHGLAGPYAVATLHRPANVDDPRQAGRMVEMLHAIADRLPVVVPLHPRGRPALLAAGLDDRHAVRLVDPLGYVAFLSLIRGATVVVTDSGGIQEETTVLGVPCVTLRTTTERPVTVEQGTNELAGIDPAAVRAAVERALAAPRSGRIPELWDGRAAERIVAVLARDLAA
jgi:UDP-N-acetylglucosamine 2-epimerase (non-hydrolysing)